VNRLLWCLVAIGCGASPPPTTTTPTPAAPNRTFAAVPVESDTFPKSAQLATDLLRRARLRGFEPPTMGKVSLEVIQLSIECVDPTLECYVAAARTLHANVLLFGEITPGPREGELQLTVSLLDADHKRFIRRATKLFPSEDDAAYDMHLVVDEATRPQ
jgi:hypothetical protein